MDPFAIRCKGIMEHIIPSTGDGQHSIFGGDVELFHIDIGIFPCPTVNVRSELLVYPLFEVWNPPSLVSAIMRGATHLSELIMKG